MGSDVYGRPLNLGEVALRFEDIEGRRLSLHCQRLRNDDKHGHDMSEFKTLIIGIFQRHF